MADGQNAVGEVRVKPDRLHAFTMAICRADGSSADEAKLVADHLVLANLFGHDSHGVGMMPAYIQNTTTGRCVRNHHAKIVKDNGAVIVIDGGVGYGQVIAKETMDIGIERAKKHGVCVVGLTNSHHIGRIGHWAEQCARAGMVSTHWVNVHGHKSLVAPFGGAEPRFSTNPYCTAVPRKGKEPIVLDFATSQVAMGKVRVANNKKMQMEQGLLIDAPAQADHRTRRDVQPAVRRHPAVRPAQGRRAGGDLRSAGRRADRRQDAFARAPSRRRHRHRQQHAVDHHRSRRDGRHRRCSRTRSRPSSPG